MYPIIDTSRRLPCKSEEGETFGAVRWIMQTATRFFEALTYQGPRALRDVPVSFHKEPILVVIKVSKDWMRDDPIICSRIPIKFTGFEDLASCSGDK